MQTYKFRCTECKADFEFPLTQEDLKVAEGMTCTECGQGRLQRVYTPLGIIFKGSGWASKAK